MNTVNRFIARYGLVLGLVTLALGVFVTVAWRNDDKLIGLSLSIAGLGLVIAVQPARA